VRFEGKDDLVLAVFERTIRRAAGYLTELGCEARPVAAAWSLNPNALGLRSSLGDDAETHVQPGGKWGVMLDEGVSLRHKVCAYTLSCKVTSALQVDSIGRKGRARCDAKISR
jgi:hypothetical protein